MTILYTVFFVVRIFVLFCFAFRAISHVIMPGSSEDGSNQEMEIRGAAFELVMDHLGPRLKRVLLYRDFLVRWTYRAYEGNFLSRTLLLLLFTRYLRSSWKVHVRT